jgi:glycerol dehydrogenase
MMEISTAYAPHEIFAPESHGDLPRPRVFLSPQRYVQGQDVLRGVGRYLSLLPARRVVLLCSERGSRNEGAQLLEGMRSEGIDCVTRVFGGECSLEEIDAHVDGLEGERIDCIVAAGGGKCVDAGKAMAFRMGAPIVVVPTLASNDAPCSALSILYSPEGVSTGVEFYPNSPAIVVVDTRVVARAPERYLVAGIGDAMATWYEARVCMLNPAAVTTVGARPTVASAAIGETCAQTLFAHGTAAAAAVATTTVNDALEAVVEANTLLSGLGFESGGLAAAHGVAQSYTSIPKVESNYLHGELVAMGTLAQLLMESRSDEAVEVATFFAEVGLPIHLGQLSLDATDRRSLDTIAEGTLEFPFIGNMPEPMSAEIVRSAVIEAHELGRAIAEQVGDAAYRRIQKG